ncbi:gamma-glutamyltransferase [Kordiimonas marina]|uniref:gamma-glutamyltransferase n=1 Tax=Kordiimonas marina TaxID=2872312 RepID=UPI001FF60157|nr:gamma-glutamyltransferase [Kordiimonas marina]MCJ9427825.1 gamma-glutamyltransferase [Kordiimonas marina]
MRLMRLFAVALAASWCFMAPVVAKDGSPIYTYETQFHPKLAKNGMVVSRDKYASEAGLEILKEGGNAVDAAVATLFSLAVTLPQAGNIGGGGFMMIYLKDQDKTIALDYREIAPKAAFRDMYLNKDGSVDNNRVRFTLKGSGVPGTVMGLTEALSKYGTLPLKQVMAPAIRLAEQGFPMTWSLNETLKEYKDRLQADPAAKKYFYKADGSVYAPGEIFRQPVLAKTLKTIAEKGADGFYKGWVADALVKTMEEGGGLITHEDLNTYKTFTRKPIIGTYRGYKIATMPPPSSGGVNLIEMLNVLENWPMKSYGLNSAAYIHRLVETMKYAYADRSKFLGDPAFYDVPVKELTSKKYAKSIYNLIDPNKATPSSKIGPAKKLPYESHETTQTSVMDKYGNMVSNTYTLNYSYGNGHAVMGAGFLLNNEMDDFSAKPGVPNGFGLLGGQANSVEAGKRPLSSMTPTFIFKPNGEPYIATGSPGGSTIITTVLQVVLNTIDFGYNPAAAVSVPRVHHQWYPDRIYMEPGLSVDTRRILVGMGHHVKINSEDSWDQVLGEAQTLMRGPNHIIMGAADPRRPGAYAAGF